MLNYYIDSNCKEQLAINSRAWEQRGDKNIQTFRKETEEISFGLPTGDTAQLVLVPQDLGAQCSTLKGHAKAGLGSVKKEQPHKFKPTFPD